MSILDITAKEFSCSHSPIPVVPRREESLITVFYEPSLTHMTAVPICPKCHKLISSSKYARHLSRCGVRHKQKKAEPVAVHGYSDIFFNKNAD